jgi:hypothetical protein
MAPRSIWMTRSEQPLGAGPPLGSSLGLVGSPPAVVCDALAEVEVTNWSYENFFTPPVNHRFSQRVIFGQNIVKEKCETSGRFSRIARSGPFLRRFPPR